MISSRSRLRMFTDAYEFAALLRETPHPAPPQCPQQCHRCPCSPSPSACSVGRAVGRHRVHPAGAAVRRRVAACLVPHPHCPAAPIGARAASNKDASLVQSLATQPAPPRVLRVCACAVSLERVPECIPVSSEPAARIQLTRLPLPCPTWVRLPPVQSVSYVHATSATHYRRSWHTTHHTCTQQSGSPMWKPPLALMPPC